MTGLVIAEIYGVSASVGVHHPKMVERKLGALGVLPAHIYYPSVGKNVWSAVDIGILRQHGDFIFLSIPPVDIGYGHKETLHGFAHARRRKNYVAIGQVGRFYIVYALARYRKFHKIFTVGIYFI